MSDEPERGPRNRRRLWIWVGVAAVVLIALTAVALEVTGRPSFCARCHEMKPVYDTWRAGSHAERADCIDCHADPGIVGYFDAHVVAGLRDVWVHVTEAPTAEDIPSPAVPPSRCLKCHEEEFEDTEFLDTHPSGPDGNCKGCHGLEIHEGLDPGE